MKKSEMFSQEALDRLKSPEQLDGLLKITNPVGWMAVAAVGILVFAAVLWSIFGDMAVKVKGVGMIIDSAGVVNVSHTTAGKVKEIAVYPGMKVKEGDLVAVLEQPLQEGEAMIARYGTHLAANGRETVSLASKYDTKRYETEISQFVYSAHDGIVGEIKVNRGDIIGAGSAICSVRRNQERDEIVGIMYVPLDEGKRVQPGMVVQMAPNGVDIAETGSLLGIVRSVSEYPVSSAGMLKVLGNQDVVSWIMTELEGAAMEVRVELVKNEKSPSGYLWSSVVGAKEPVTPGSVCKTTVVVERKPPIEKVFYKISQWLRNR